MATEMLTRRRVLQTAAVAASGLTVPLVRRAGAAVGSVPTGSMTLAWHTNIAPRWLDPQQHDGGATPDNFLNVLQDALIKNFRDELYDHLALAERYEFAEDAKSATFWLRPSIKFHNGAPVTPEDVKWSYEHYHGAWAKVLQDRTDGVEILGDRAIRFTFKRAFLDFPRLIGTANVSGAGWVVPAKYYQEVGPDGLRRSQLVPGHIGWWHRNRERGSTSRLLTITTVLFTSSASQSSACRKRRPASRCSSAAKLTSCISCLAS